MFREVALVTFTAGMLGTSAATLVNAYDPVPHSPPAIERATEPAPAAAERASGMKKPNRDLVVVKRSRSH